MAWRLGKPTRSGILCERGGPGHVAPVATEARRAHGLAGLGAGLRRAMVRRPRPRPPARNAPARVSVRAFRVGERPMPEIDSRLARARADEQAERLAPRGVAPQFLAEAIWHRTLAIGSPPTDAEVVEYLARKSVV